MRFIHHNLEIWSNQFLQLILLAVLLVWQWIEMAESLFVEIKIALPCISFWCLLLYESWILQRTHKETETPSFSNGIKLLQQFIFFFTNLSSLLSKWVKWICPYNQLATIELGSNFIWMSKQKDKKIKKNAQYKDRTCDLGVISTTL